MEMNLKKTQDKLKIMQEENTTLLLKNESLQAKSKGDENEFIFKYDELKTELEQKFNDIKEEYTQIQNENEKRLALLEQENGFLQKEAEKLENEVEMKNGEINSLKIELETSVYESEGIKKEMSEMEVLKQKELYLLKNEFEKKMKEVIFYLKKKKIF